tara:strand:+ start:669 stop:1361 length:693 start_codon:yes stop_codon:yes gene_type:complete
MLLAVRPDGTAVAHKFLLDILAGLQKEAGKVLIVTAFGTVVPWLDRLPVQRRTVVLGALALVASMLGGLLNNGGAVSRVGGVAVVSAVVLLAVMFGEHLRPRPPPPMPVEPRPPAWRAGLRWAALPTSAVALGVPVWLIVGSAAHRRRELVHREEETRRELSATRRELSALQRELARALVVLRGPPTGGSSDESSEEGTGHRQGSGATEAPPGAQPQAALPPTPSPREQG